MPEIIVRKLHNRLTRYGEESRGFTDFSLSPSDYPNARDPSFADTVISLTGCKEAWLVEPRIDQKVSAQSDSPEVVLWLAHMPPYENESRG